MKKIVFALAGIASLVSFGEPGMARLYRTTSTSAFRERVATFPSKMTGPGANVIDLDAAKPSHDFLGLGVSFAESSAYLWSKFAADRFPASHAAVQREIMELLWTEKGAGLSIGRIHIGASDYSMHLYTYDDTPGDTELKHFSIDDDRRFVLPAIRAAQAVNKDIYFFASPWSPPAWMKSGGTLCGGRLNPSSYPVYAQYLLRFLKSYADEGVPVSALTVQNEPETEQAKNSPTCLWSADESAEFTTGFLAPAIKASGLNTQIWAYDHNFSDKGVEYVMKQLADPAFRDSVSALAWHPYVGSPTNLAPVRAAYPAMPMYVTEMGPHVDRTKRDMLWWSDLVLGAFNEGCGAFVSWCFLLDEDGQPNITPGFGCGGLLEIDSRTGELYESSQFRLFRHIGPFVKRGAKVLKAPIVPGEASKGVEDVKHVVFRNPDGSHVAVLACRAGKFDRRQVQFKLGDYYYSVQVLGESVTTVLIPPSR
ncbi:MAG: hypothetical protein IJI73_04730 [Kiritimatiellae bacterium]|nr:hypothetical protein [Kiritimatiellia bacterium]